MSTPASRPIPLPVTILSGFLGAGKTTLLNRLLRGAPDGARIAVLENELGGVPVDDVLVAEVGPARLDTVLGRTCCEARAEFVAQLRSVAAAAADFDRLIIETTGVAHPGMLAHAFLSDPVLKAAFRLDGIVTVVDAEHFATHEGGDGHALEQVAYADAIVVNKRDLVGPVELVALTGHLRRINGTARILTAQQADVPVAELLDLGGFDLTRIEQGVAGCREHGGAQGETGNRKAESGTGYSERASAGPDAESGAHAHRHEIGTVAVRTTDRYDFTRFRAWLEGFIAANADDLYRAKGVVALAGVAERLVFQGVHGRFQAGLGRAWVDETPETRIVFIGRDLDRAAILDGLAGCRAEEVPA